MKIDTLGRRKRTTSQSRGRGYVITPGVRRVIAAIRRYGPLPTPILFLYWFGDGRSNYRVFQGVMERLFHEPYGKEPLVIRPKQLNPDIGPNPEPAWHGLSDTGLALAQSGSDIILPLRGDPMHHRGMGACIGASFDLGAPARNMRLMDLEEILSHEKCPAETRIAKNALEMHLPKGARLVPDALQGFEYIGNGFKFFAREDDLATESFSRTDPNQTAVEEKLDKYIEVFSSRLYQKQWGLLKLHGVLFTTTKPGRIKKMLEYLADKPYGDRFYFKALPTFERFSWRAPRAPLDEVFEPWMTINGPKDITQP